MKVTFKQLEKLIANLNSTKEFSPLIKKINRWVKMVRVDNHTAELDAFEIFALVRLLAEEGMQNLDEFSELRHAIGDKIFKCIIALRSSEHDSLLLEVNSHPVTLDCLCTLAEKFYRLQFDSSCIRDLIQKSIKNPAFYLLVKSLCDIDYSRNQSILHNNLQAILQSPQLKEFVEFFSICAERRITITSKHYFVFCNLPAEHKVYFSYVISCLKDVIPLNLPELELILTHFHSVLRLILATADDIESSEQLFSFIVAMPSAAEERVLALANLPDDERLTYISETKSNHVKALFKSNPAIHAIILSMDIEMNLSKKLFTALDALFNVGFNSANLRLFITATKDKKNIIPTYAQAMVDCAKLHPQRFMPLAHQFLMHSDLSKCTELLIECNTRKLFPAHVERALAYPNPMIAFRVCHLLENKISDPLLNEVLLRSDIDSLYWLFKSFGNAELERACGSGSLEKLVVACRGIDLNSAYIKNYFVNSKEIAECLAKVTAHPKIATQGVLLWKAAQPPAAINREGSSRSEKSESGKKGEKPGSDKRMNSL